MSEGVWRSKRDTESDDVAISAPVCTGYREGRLAEDLLPDGNRGGGNRGDGNRGDGCRRGWDEIMVRLVCVVDVYHSDCSGE